MSAGLLELERKWHAANNAWNEATIRTPEWHHWSHEAEALAKRLVAYPAQDLEDVWTKYRFFRFWWRCDLECEGICQNTKDALAAFEAAFRAVCGDGNGEPLPDRGIES